MVRTLFRGVLWLVLALVVLWAVWMSTGRTSNVPSPSDDTPVRSIALGSDAGHGNMLAVQPWVTPHDYASAQSLQQKMETYLTQAQRNGWLNAKTVAVFPEYIGTWLVAAGEKETALASEGIAPAMTTVALTHLPQFLYYLATAPAVADPARWALFSLKAERMARDYETVFGNLSRQFGIYVVAGSIVLPQPSVKDGRLTVQPGGAMVNVSALFGPDGRIAGPLVVKSFPIDEEQRFSVAGRVEDIPVFDTPAGKLAILVCADSWYPQAYAIVKQRGAQIVAVPSFSSSDGIWQTKWKGYNGGPTAQDVDPSDIGRITEGQAWQKYAMAGRAAAQGMPHGVNVFLRGTLWDLGTDGATISLQAGRAVTGALVDQAVLTNLWLP